MKSKLKTLVAATIGMALLGAQAEATTYAVSLFDGNSTSGLSIAGSITTDSAVGTLTASNILDWDLIGVLIQSSNVTVFQDWKGPLSGQNSTIKTATNIIATQNTL